MSDQPDAFEAATCFFGAKLQEIMDTGLSRRDIAEAAHLQTSTVSRLINGARLNPALGTVLRVAHAFDKEPGDLMPTLAELKQMVNGTGTVD